MKKLVLQILAAAALLCGSAHAQTKELSAADLARILGWDHIRHEIKIQDGERLVFKHGDRDFFEVSRGKPGEKLEILIAYKKHGDYFVELYIETWREGKPSGASSGVFLNRRRAEVRQWIIEPPTNLKKGVEKVLYRLTTKGGKKHEVSVLLVAPEG